MDLELGGKIAVVTGGASGIGRRVAQDCAREGARVAVLDLDGDGAARAAAECGGVSARVDVTSPTSVKAAFDDVRGRLGAPDIYVHCAGVWNMVPALELPPEKARLEIEVNLLGLIHCCREVAPDLVARQGGRIVAIASDAAKIGEKYMASYAASKAGVIAYCKSLARELGRWTITVNCVCPSMIETPMTAGVTPEMKAQIVKNHPIRRLGRPEDISDAILFLASGRASWITGQALSVNGGYVMQ